MSVGIRGPRLALVVVAFVLVSTGPASAVAAGATWTASPHSDVVQVDGPLDGNTTVDGSLDGNTTVDGPLDDNTTVDGSHSGSTSDGPTTNETDPGGDIGVSTSLGDGDGGDANVSVDRSGVSADASVNGSGVAADVNGSVNDTGAIADAHASADDATASVGVSADENGTSANATVDVGSGSVGVGVDAGQSNDATTVTAGSEADTRTGATSGTTAVGPGDHPHGATSTPPTGATATATLAGTGPARGGSGPSGGPTVPATPTAAGAMAIAGSAIVVRKGTTMVTMAPMPAGVVDTVSAGVGRLHTELPRLLVPFGYSRYDSSDPLEHDVRAALYETVQTVPGIHLSGLEDDVDVSLSSVRHHVRVLEEESMIESRKIRGKRRYFPTGEIDPELVAALDDPPTGSVLRTVAMIEPTTTTELAEQLGRDPSTISHHLEGLEDAGLVDRERDGQAVPTRLSDRSRQFLDTADTGGLPTSAD